MAVKEGELAQLAGLKAEWQGYRKLLSDVGVRLQKAKADFKDDLIASLNAFNDQVTGMRTDFLRNAPFDASVPPEKARDSEPEPGPGPGPEPEPDALGHWGIGASGPKSPLYLPYLGAGAHRGVPRTRRGRAYAGGRDGRRTADLLNRPSREQG